MTLIPENGFRKKRAHRLCAFLFRWASLTKKLFPKSLTYSTYRLMQNLKYPPEERNIALDYDATASTNVKFWQNFVVLAQANGYNVYIVTARHPNRMEEPKLYFEHLVRGIIATSHKAKKAYCREIGLEIDIFIDDSPWNVYVNIDGSTPKSESFSLLNPDFGVEIANMLFPRNHPLTVRGYGFYFTDCYHEVPLIQQSFHRTKAGAYRAMRKFLVERSEEHYSQYKQEERRWRHDKKKPSGKRQKYWYGPFAYAKWAVKPATLYINE